MKLKDMSVALAVLRGSIPAETEQKLRNPVIKALLRFTPGPPPPVAHQFENREAFRAAILFYCVDLGFNGAEEFAVIDAALEELPFDPTFADVEKPASLTAESGLDAIIAAAGNGDEIDLVVMVESQGNPYSRRQISAEVTWSKQAREANGGLAVIRIPASRLVAPLLSILEG